MHRVDRRNLSRQACRDGGGMLHVAKQAAQTYSLSSISCTCNVSTQGLVLLALC